MNIPIAMTLKGFTNNQNLDYVPAAGELLLDKETNLLKIGDGKTAVKDLCFISCDLSGTYEPENNFVISNEAKEFIKNNKDLIARNCFDYLYDELLLNPPLMREVTSALLYAGINPKEYLYRVPGAIADMLSEPPHNSEWTTYIDTGEYYTKQELDTRFQGEVGDGACLWSLNNPTTNDIIVRYSD